MALTHGALRERIEQPGGPPLIAFWNEGEATSEYRGGSHDYDWHSHLRGQLICIESGLVHARTRNGSWLLPPRRAGWMPPGVEHTVSISGDLSGWGVFIVPEVCTQLPAEPCVLGTSELMVALVRRASQWAEQASLQPPQERVMAVLLDELRLARREPLHLSMPSDRRLRRVTQALLAQPEDNRSQQQWAEWAGLSTRSLSRLFRAETALSFAQWRQQARLSRALEQLAEGEPVASVADRLGYASPSAFIAMFRRCFGQSPTRYFARRGDGRLTG